MKKISKIMIFLLVSVMFVTCCFVSSAQGSMTVSAGSANAKAGEQVTVTVRLENNTGMNYLKVQISYDDSVMTLSSVKNGKLFDNLASMPGNTSANPFTMVYAGAGDENYSGALFTLTFNVSEKAASGKYNIGVSVAQCTNQSNENVSVSARGAVITVEGETTTSKETTTSPKETTTRPKATTTSPKETTTSPKATTTSLKETSVNPTVPTTLPKTTATSVDPKVTTTSPKNSTTDTTAVVTTSETTAVYTEPAGDSTESNDFIDSYDEFSDDSEVYESEDGGMSGALIAVICVGAVIAVAGVIVVIVVIKKKKK